MTDRELAKMLGMHYLELPPPPAKRIPQHQEDWGDEDTVGVFVKEKGRGLGDGKSGRYLGIVEGKPTIRLEFDGFKLVSELIQFDSIEQMKETWWLD